MSKWYCRPCGAVFIRLPFALYISRESQRQPADGDMCMECRCDHEMKRVWLAKFDENTKDLPRRDAYKEEAP
jgi:hypothetical protein